MSYNNYHSRNNKKRYSPPHSRNSNTRYSPPQDSPNRQRHYQGYNPFLDNAQENERHKETINECKQLRQNEVSNNPYMDPNLVNSFQYFNLQQDKAFINQHSVNPRSQSQFTDHESHNGHHAPPDVHDSMQPEVITPDHVSDWCNDVNESKPNHVKTIESSANTHQNDKNSETSTAEEDKIKIKADNPYHPTNFYKDQNEEQDTAVALVSQYRVSPKDVLKADAVQREYEQFMYSLEAMQESHQNGYEYNDSHDYSNNNHYYNNGYHRQNSNNIGIDDMIPGQEMITPCNFNTLQKDDTVWIRNDDGDWEIFKVIKMEKTTGGYNQQRNCYEETYVGTFKMGDRELTIWQGQTEEEFRMARYIKETNYAYPIMEDMYAVNNIFKVKTETGDGNFVLKRYDKSTGIADLVCVKTGNRSRINLSQVEHSIIGN
eukprot:202484_1